MSSVGLDAVAGQLCLLLTVWFDIKILGEIGVHFGFGEADDFRGEFDKRQATLPHEIVNCPPADIQTPGNL